MKLSEIRSLMRRMPDYKVSKNPEEQRQLLRQLGLEPGELYQELEMESRFVDTHQDSSWSNATVSLHSHSFYELLYCTGSCQVEYLVGSDRYRLQKGDVLLIAPGISHRPLLPEHMTEAYRRDVLWLSAEFMESLVLLFPAIQEQRPLYSTLLRTGGTRWESLGELFRKGVREAEAQAPGWEMAVLGNSIQILSLLYRAFLDQSTAPMKAEKPELLDQVLAYVEAHLDSKITLEEIARHFYVSESTVSQTFRKKMGVPFHRCVTQRRLIAAKSLIAQGIQLEVVGQQVGFSDYSTFYRAFKQEYGISPRQYRKLQENMEPIL